MQRILPGREKPSQTSFALAGGIIKGSKAVHLSNMLIHRALRIHTPLLVAIVVAATSANVSEAVEVLIVRPDAPGTIVWNRALSPELAWDNNGSTSSTVTKTGNQTPFSGISEFASTNPGTIVGVSLVVDGAASDPFTNDQVQTRWVASWSDMGQWHLLPTDGTRDTTSFDVTLERSWSWADFDSVEMIVDHDKQGGSDGSYYLYEIWFEVSYVPAISVQVTVSTFPFGTMPLDSWASPQGTEIINDGTVVEDFNGRLSVFTAGAHTWSLSPSNNGPDTVRAQWSTVGPAGPWNDVDVYDTDFVITTGVAPSDTVGFWLRILTPTSTGSYAEHASTLTVSAIEG